MVSKLENVTIIIDYFQTYTRDLYSFTDSHSKMRLWEENHSILDTFQIVFQSFLFLPWDLQMGNLDMMVWKLRESGSSSLKPKLYMFQQESGY